MAYISPDVQIAGNDQDVVATDNNSNQVMTLDRDAVWPALSVPYQMRDTVHVRNNAHLVISPGTVFEFGRNAGLSIVGATLDADASSGDPIIFDGVEQIQSFWKGLEFGSSWSATNKLINVEIRNGGSAGWGTGGDIRRANIYMRNATQTGGGEALVHIEDALIAGSGNYGISVWTGSEVTGCSGVVFENNADLDVQTHGGSGTTCF